MKGVAWTVPVIVAAVGAPPAAASPGPISATASWLSGNSPLYSKVGGGGQTFDGVRPESLSIKNTGMSSFIGTITVTITLKPVGTVTAGIGVESLLPATVSKASVFTQHESTVIFSHSTTIESGQSTNFPVRFHYETINPTPKSVSFSYKMTTSVLLTGNSGGSLSQWPTTPDPTIIYTK